jgi:Hsp70 protein
LVAASPTTGRKEKEHQNVTEDGEKKTSSRQFSVLPLSLHLETVGGLATPVVLRGTPLPTERSQALSTASDNQESVLVQILMGESPLAKHNILLSTFTMKGIPKAERGTPDIRVTYSVDRLCNITATATVNGTEIKVDSEYCDAQQFLTDAKIKTLLQQAETDRTSDEELVKLIEATNKAQSTLAKAEVLLRDNQKNALKKPDEELQKGIAALGLALDGKNAESIRDATQAVERAMVPLDPLPFQSVFGNDIFSGFFQQAIKGRSVPSKGRQSKPQVKPEQPRPIKAVPKNNEISTPRVNPSNYGRIFGGGQFTLDPNLCFVLMPFEERLRPFYEDHIRPVLQGEGLSCVRADEILGTNLITWDIWERINRARFLIADLTGQNPNVFYELGIAHALGKDVLLLTQDMAHVPFDLKALRYILYNFTPRGVKDFETTLKATILELMKSS